MIRELSTRLYNKLSGNGTLVGLTTGIYLGKAPQNQDYAYITFWPVSETSRHMHDSIIEDTLWQVDVWDSSITSMTSIQEEIKTSLDGQVLALSTLTQVGLVRALTSPLIPDHEEQGGTIWHQAIEYNILVQ